MLKKIQDWKKDERVSSFTRFSGFQFFTRCKIRDRYYIKIMMKFSRWILLNLIGKVINICFFTD
jgi:hypothetical protein